MFKCRPSSENHKYNLAVTIDCKGRKDDPADAATGWALSWDSCLFKLSQNIMNGNSRLNTNTLSNTTYMNKKHLSQLKKQRILVKNIYLCL